MQLKVFAMESRAMGVFHYLVTGAVLTLVLRWLWKAAGSERAKLESGRQIFPPTKAVRFLLILFAMMFSAFAVVSVVLVHEARNWWVPYLFLGFATLVLLSFPPVLIIDIDSVGSRTWFGHEKTFRWEDIASLQYNIGNRYFTVQARDGRKITHSGFNADPKVFRAEIQRHTRLPMKVLEPGLGKAGAYEIPYDETEPREDA
jgi:hypothetical protein